MVQTLSSNPPETSGSYLILHDISWEMYEQLLTIFADRSVPRLTYYKGTLELMTPRSDHESYSWTLGRLVIILSEELGLEIRGLKSTTWRSRPEAVGKEPDECFYIQNEPIVRGTLKIDLTVAPPPDLVIEVDTTHSSLDQMAIYRELRVPEVWRWHEGQLKIHLLTETGYLESETSLAFGSFPVLELTRFMQFDSQRGENARMREFRQWVRTQISQRVNF